MKRLLFLLISFHLIILQAYAQETPQKESSSKIGIAPFPIIAFNPDTNLILGFGSVIYRKPETAGSKTDDLTLTAYYSLKKQYCVAMMGSVYAHDDFFLIQPSIVVQKFPTDFYGIGPDTPESYKEKYTPVSAPLGLSVMVRIADKIYFGPSYDFRYYNVIKTEENKMLDSGTIVGSGKSISSGAGAMCVIDYRDSGLNPSIGMYASISSLYYSSAIESDSTFSVSTADVRGYYTFRKITFGVQGVCTAATGDIPFSYYPSVGNDGIVRGYLSGRYIDRRFTAIQGEIRFPIYSRFSGTAFAGAGEVAHTFPKLGEHIRPAGGMGLRYMIDKSERINLRADVTYNGDEIYAYVNIKEAF